MGEPENFIYNRVLRCAVVALRVRNESVGDEGGEQKERQGEKGKSLRLDG